MFNVKPRTMGSFHEPIILNFGCKVLSHFSENFHIKIMVIGSTVEAEQPWKETVGF